MNFNRKQTLVFALILFVGTACSKEESAETLDSDIPIVEAYLVPGHDVNVNLSTMIPYSTEEVAGSVEISGIEVSIIAADGTEYPMLETALGTYHLADSVLNVSQGEQYTLAFSYNDSLVSATTTIPAKPIDLEASFTTIELERIEAGEAPSGGGSIVDPIEILWDNPSNDYHLIMIEYLENDFDQVNANFVIDDVEELRQTATEPISGNGYNIDQRRIYFFGTYRVILFKINQEYASLYEALSQSSQSLSQPITNVQNGLGIFTGLNADTLFIEVEEL